MGERTFLLRCGYSDCGKETKIILAAPPSSRRRGKQEKIQLTRYCEHCNRPNIITVPNLGTQIQVDSSMVTINR